VLLGPSTSDVRTPDNLIDGVNDSVDGHHSWLAPILPNTVSLSVCLCICFTDTVQLCRSTVSFLVAVFAH